MNVSLVHLVPLASISNASCSSLDILSGYLAKTFLSSNEGEQGQRLQCLARWGCSSCRVMFVARSLKHRHVWPMHTEPRDIGISYTTPVVRSVHFSRCFVLHLLTACTGKFILRRSLDSLLGAEKTTGTSYRSATFLRFWFMECIYGITTGLTALLSRGCLCVTLIFSTRLSATSTRTLRGKPALCKRAALIREALLCNLLAKLLRRRPTKQWDNPSFHNLGLGTWKKKNKKSFFPPWLLFFYHFILSDFQFLFRKGKSTEIDSSLQKEIILQNIEKDWLR